MQTAGTYGDQTTLTGHQQKSDNTDSHHDLLILVILAAILFYFFHIRLQQAPAAAKVLPVESKSSVTTFNPEDLELKVDVKSLSSSPVNSGSSQSFRTAAEAASSQLRAAQQQLKEERRAKKTTSRRVRNNKPARARSSEMSALEVPTALPFNPYNRQQSL
ncbi:unnamed protein product, partial [Mesorhabditis spiculigera]